MNVESRYQDDLEFDLFGKEELDSFCFWAQVQNIHDRGDDRIKAIMAELVDRLDVAIKALEKQKDVDILRRMANQDLRKAMESEKKMRKKWTRRALELGWRSEDG